MSLLDKVLSANGETSPNYGRRGTYIGTLRRIRLRDPSEEGANPDLKPGFRVDIDVLWCSRPEGDFVRGDTATFTDPFKFPNSALARVRRSAAVAKASKTGAPCPESTFALVRADGEDDKAFAKRVKDEIGRIIGPDQPCNGALVKVVATEGKNKTTGSVYTLFDLELPTKDDLVTAGLIQA
jgi:hypothetical protein